MSIVSRAGGTSSLPSGAVTLFSGSKVPEGYERLSRLVPPSDVYARSQRVALLDSPLSSLPEYHVFNDSTSDEHVYIAYSTVLRRLHLPTGGSEVMSAPPSNLGSGGMYVSGVSVQGGALFWSVGSTASVTYTAGLRFNTATQAWTSLSPSPAGMGVTLAYDEPNSCVYQLGGYQYRSTGNLQSYSVYRYDIATNTHTQVTTEDGTALTLPSAVNSGQGVVLGDSIVFTGSGLRALNLTTGGVSTIPLPSGVATSSPMSLYRLSDSSGLLSAGGALYRVSKPEGSGWTVTPADVAGTGNGWSLGVKGCAGLHRPVGGGTLVHYDPTTTADPSLLGLLMLDGLADPPNANVFYARKK